MTNKDELMEWEYQTISAIKGVLAELHKDAKGDVIYDGEEKVRLETAIKSISQLRQILIDVGNEAWYAYVPFENGEAVYPDKTDDLVDEILNDEIVLLKEIGLS